MYGYEPPGPAHLSFISDLVFSYNHCFNSSYLVFLQIAFIFILFLPTFFILFMVKLLVRHVQTSIQSISFISEFTLKIILVLKDSLVLFWWFHYGCCIIFFFFFRCSSLWFSAVLKEYAFGFFLIWGYGSTEDFCFVSTINPTSTILLLQIFYFYLYLCVCHVPTPPCQYEGQSGTQFSCFIIEVLGIGLRNPAVSHLADP